MSERLTIRLFNAQQGHKAVQDAWQTVKAWLTAGHRLVLEVKPETRSLAQNSRLWAMLTDISRQVDWYGNKLTPEEWKDVFSAALKKQKVVPGLDGGFVVCGQRTSRMTKSEMSDLQELMSAFGSERAVEFRDAQKWQIDPATGELT